ncbi:PEP-CTERM sorting domain-containing protein [Aestuariibacter sp. A3R04]|uniref:PEP-CTERM sorting domain-containing protein n=1 Tax=Aestuariibacter sp. A3R04 TaxID=2841571 RepID=UPI001C085912|nr:PEP-CTERM sorting domain-containing protein [Aestuariibacter sp. A3R04]MBU3022281.1 PEP-CTERM sorting domain-containing protein [Aestuariibacter sp. A3R04]
MKFSTKAAVLLTTIFASTAHAGIINSYDIDFSALPLTAHQQNSGSYSTWDFNGSVLNLKEDAWFTLNVNDAFGIASLDIDNASTNIELSFDFRVKANSAGSYSEIAGIWLADFSGGEQNYDAGRTFNLDGTQNFGLDDIAYTNGESWQTFTIKLDDYMAGIITDIVFINDCDASVGCSDMNVRFRNASISEVSEPTAMSLILLGMGFMGWRARRQK